MRQALFADADRPGYCRLVVEPGQIKATIFGHAEFTTFNQTVTRRFADWKQAKAPLLIGIQIGDRPKALIEELSESLLAAFQAAPLIDAKVAAQYAQLGAADIQTLVVQDKWLAERYATPLPALGDEVELLARRVDAHLKTMGFTL